MRVALLVTHGVHAKRWHTSRTTADDQDLVCLFFLPPIFPLFFFINWGSREAFQNDFLLIIRKFETLIKLTRWIIVFNNASARVNIVHIVWLRRQSCNACIYLSGRIDVWAPNFLKLTISHWIQIVYQAVTVRAAVTYTRLLHCVHVQYMYQAYCRNVQIVWHCAGTLYQCKLLKVIMIQARQ